jgi:hypothetical protein
LSCATLVLCSAIPVAAQTNDIDTPTAHTIATQSPESLSPEQAPPAQQPEPKKKEAAPEHLSTGWRSLLKDSASDFVAFPKRRSTWTILGIGAAAALAVHPADDYVESHIVGNEAADNFFRLGHWVGSSVRVSRRTVGRRPLRRRTRGWRIPDKQVFGGRL